MTEAATAVCTKKVKMDVFSTKNPLLLLQFALIKPDVTFSLEMLNKIKPLNDIS